MEQTMNLQNDPVFEKIQEETKKDAAIMEPVLEEILVILKDKIEGENDFNLKHGFLTAAKAIMHMTQALCDSEEMFNTELDAAQRVAIDRVMPAVLPKVEEGKIVEEGYDLENLSVRRLMMTMGTAIDYIFWRNEVSKYSEMREELEKVEESEEVANTAE